MGKLNLEGIVPPSRDQEFYMKKGYPIMGGCTLCIGIVMFGIGLGVRITQQNLAAVSSVSALDAPNVLLVAGILSIVAGGFLIIVTKCTNITIAKVKMHSLIFIGILSIAALLTFVAAILGFVYAGQASDKMEDDMTMKLQDYGVTGRYKSLTIVDNMQSKEKCCGVFNYADWRNTVYAGNRYDKVPDSCCKVQEHACGFEFEISKINREGCLETVKQSMRRALLLVGITGIIVFLIEGFLAVFAFCIRKKHFT